MVNDVIDVWKKDKSRLNVVYDDKSPSLAVVDFLKFTFGWWRRIMP